MQKARTEVKQISQEILDGYMQEIEELSKEYEVVCADPETPEYYLYHVEAQLDRLETLAYLYMNFVATQRKRQSS